MLSRLPVRTKLLAILVPPLVALAVIGGVGINERVQGRRTADRTVTIARTARAADLWVNELQRERLVAVASQLGEPAVTQAQLEEQVRISDKAGTELTARLAELSAIGDSSERSFGPSTAAARYTAKLSGVAELRALNLEANVPLRTLADRYSALIETVLDTTAELFLGADELPSSAQASHWLSEAKEADARAAALGTIVLNEAPAGTEWIASEIHRQDVRAGNLTSVFLNDTDRTGRAALDAARQTPQFVASIVAFSTLSSLSPSESLNSRLESPLSMKQFVATATARFDALTDAERTIIAGEVARAERSGSQSDRSLRFFVGGVLLALILAFAVAMTVARSIGRSLGILTRAARTITTEQLPLLVESMRSPDAAGRLEVSEIELKARDELGDLAESFNLLQRAAVEVAASQAQALRTGISDIFVNLARRNQTLLDRQIEFIDRLEANEEDPDQLEHLFRLDHLATRMRRNAESLLVLAGAEPPRRRAREVALSDVIRVAVGEVEDFSRVNLLAVDEATVVGGSAVDIAHLLSELMENGAQYSPPDRMVEVVGHRLTDGGYVISVADHGVGMNAEQLNDANQLLANPPAIGLSLSRSLGFVVASTLAARHGISLKLVHGPTGGVTAHVMLPASIVVTTAPEMGPGEGLAKSVGSSALSGQAGIGFSPMAKSALVRGPAAPAESPRPGVVAPSRGAAPSELVETDALAPADATSSAPAVASEPDAARSSDFGTGAPRGGWTVSGEYVSYDAAEAQTPTDAGGLPQRRGKLFDARAITAASSDTGSDADAARTAPSSEGDRGVETMFPASPFSATGPVGADEPAAPSMAGPFATGPFGTGALGTGALGTGALGTGLPPGDGATEAPAAPSPDESGVGGTAPTPGSAPAITSAFGAAAADLPPLPGWPEAPVVSASLTPPPPPPPPHAGIETPSPTETAPTETAPTEPTEPIGSPAWAEHPATPEPPARSPQVPALSPFETSPAKLADAVPMGVAFEEGLFSLLDTSSPAPIGADQAPDPGLPEQPATASGLPQRERGRTDFGATAPQDRVGAPSRPPQEIRSLLSRYREGLSTGRGSEAASAPDAGAGSSPQSIGSDDTTANPARPDSGGEI